MENVNNIVEERMQAMIDRISTIIETHGDFSVSDVQADYSPTVDGDSKLSHLMEDFSEDGGRVYVYDPSSHDSSSIDKYDADYWDLSESQLEYVLKLAEQWGEINED